MMYFEVFDAVRRIILSAVVGFMGTSPIKATFGLGLAFFSGIVQREMAPYGFGMLNLLHTYTQYMIMYTFFSALLIIAHPFGYGEWSLGLSILLINLVAFAIAGAAVKRGYQTAVGLRDQVMKVHPTSGGAPDDRNLKMGGAPAHPDESA